MDIALEALSVRYEEDPVVREIGLNVPDGSWAGLIGPNGAGKTTVLRAVAGLVPHRGGVRLGGDH
jgi:ABC-type Mn2+/Zn2+ transport system ATPase subunit